MTTWQIDVFDDATDALVEEIDARSPNRVEVRELWGVAAGDPIYPLLVTSENLAFVNALLDAPLELVNGRSAFLCEFQEYDGETVDD